MMYTARRYRLALDNNSSAKWVIIDLSGTKNEHKLHVVQLQNVSLSQFQGKKGEATKQTLA